MRFVVGTLALLGVGAISLALADPSTTAAPAAPAADTQPVPAAAAPQTTPVAATPAAAPAKPAVDPDERRLIGEGYKPEMHNGEKLFCKREEELGTRLGGVKHCGTVAQLKAEHAELRENIEKAQRNSVMPQGR
jgi:hypothetical protein